MRCMCAASRMRRQTPRLQVGLRKDPFDNISETPGSITASFAGSAAHQIGPARSPLVAIILHVGLSMWTDRCAAASQMKCARTHVLNKL